MHIATKMKPAKISKEIKTPEGVSVSLDSGRVTVTGPKGSLSREMIAHNVGITIQPDKILLLSIKPSKKEKMMLGTFYAHIKNMIKGVTLGYTYKLKVSSGHFPISVSMKGNIFEIKNFFGERKPRIAKILDDVKVTIHGEMIDVTGTDLEKVSQTSANIEQATRITNRDKRVFMDRINIISKDEN